LSHSADGGQLDATRATCPKTRCILPCENDQAKLNHISRLACSTNLSKILAAFRLSGAVWIEAQAVTLRCPRTCLRPLTVRFTAFVSVICTNFLSLPDFNHSVKPRSFVRLRPLKLVVGGCSSVANFDQLAGV
jgi:hypothetical protein